MSASFYALWPSRLYPFPFGSGGVLGVAALGEDIPAARERVYQAVKAISFEGMHYRADIANKALNYKVESRE